AEAEQADTEQHNARRLGDLRRIVRIGPIGWEVRHAGSGGADALRLVRGLQIGTAEFAAGGNVDYSAACISRPTDRRFVCNEVGRKERCVRRIDEGCPLDVGQASDIEEAY